MNITHRPWFEPLLGLLVLALLAWLQSPLQSLALAAPWVCAMVGSRALVRAWPEEPPATPPRVESKLRQGLALALGGAFLAAFALLVWWRITGRGLVGWLDDVQARDGGHYSQSTSLLTAVAYLFNAVMLVLAAALPGERRRRTLQGATPARAVPASRALQKPMPAAAAQPDTADTGKHALAWFFGSLIAVTWLVGGVAYTVVTWRQQAELQAHYTPVDIDRNAAATADEFVALQGRRHPRGHWRVQAVAEWGQASTSTFYVPWVAANAQPDDPVHWIVRAEGQSLPPLPSPLLAHAATLPLPAPVQAGLERNQVHLANDVRLLDQVPSVDGQVVDRRGEPRTLLFSAGGLATVIFLAMWGVLELMGLRQRRRALPATP